MKVKIISIVLILIFTISCKNDKKTTETIKIEEQVNEETHNHEAIVFNNGKKWKVVDHMMAHILKMNKDVSNFKGTTVKDYKNLSAKLITNINLLTANCTMTGQAHDELHKWLLPYIDLANDFTEVKTKKEAQEQFKKIQNSFKDLNIYFK